MNEKKIVTFLNLDCKKKPDKFSMKLFTWFNLSWGGLVILCLFIFLTSSCATTNSKKINYYSNEKNYIEVTSVINHVVFDEEQQILYLGFSNLPKEFDDDCFKIVGNNYSTVADVSKELIQIGKTATFITAPKYFGDGYVMPIVSLTIDNHLILEYEIGFSNFLDWLKT